MPKQSPLPDISALDQLSVDGGRQDGRHRHTLPGTATRSRSGLFCRLQTQSPESGNSSTTTWRLWADFGNMAVRSPVSGEFTIHESPPLAGFFSMKEGNSPNFTLAGWGGRVLTSRKRGLLTHCKSKQKHAFLVDVIQRCATIYNSLRRAQRTADRRVQISTMHDQK